MMNMQERLIILVCLRMPVKKKSLMYFRDEDQLLELKELYLHRIRSQNTAGIERTGQSLRCCDGEYCKTDHFTP